MTIFINLAGLILMALVVWWFWLSHRKTSAQATTQEATIIVEDGVYTPASIRAKSGQSLTRSPPNSSNNPPDAPYTPR